MINVGIPDIQGAETEARKALGAPYAYLDLVAAGLYNLFGINLRASGRKINICSETWVRILRAGGLDILPGVDADCVSPMDLYRAIVKA